MNVNKNLKYNSNSVARLFHNGLAKKFMYNQADCYYDSATSKWMIKNNLGNYEQWGLMPTVATLEGVTTYKGKLVILSTDSHEYKWNGSQWVDLGVGPDIKIGWLAVSANFKVYTNYKISDIYSTNNYVRVRHTANITETGFMFWAGNSPWFSLERSSNVSYGAYYNLGTSTFFNKNGITKWYSTTDGWAEVEINNGTGATRNSDQQSYYSSVNYTGTSNGNLLILGTSGSAATGQFYNLCVWDSQNGNPIHNYYASLDNNNVPCLYDAVTKTYLYNQIASPATQPTFTQTGTLPGGIPEEYPSRPQTSFYQSADSFTVINNAWSYNIDATNEIVSNITNATKPYAYNTSDSKWYVKNNLGNYEQWGLMPTVSDLNNVTTYTGKLVVLSTDSHEYKWNGTQWVDLGGYINNLVAITCDTISSKSMQPAFKITNNGADFVLSATRNDVEVVVKFEKTISQISSIGGSDHVIFGSNTVDDLQEFESFLAGTNLYYDIGGPSRVYINGNNTFTPNTQYNVKFTNGHYAGTQLGYSNNQCIFVDDTLKGSNSKANKDNTNSSTYISSQYIDIYEVKIYDDNGVIYDLKPAKLQDDSLTFYDSINGIYATCVLNLAKLLGKYESTIPEEYPSKPAPTLSQTKASYQAALNGSYLNGQTVSVYGNTYTVSNGKLTN